MLAALALAAVCQLPPDVNQAMLASGRVVGVRSGSIVNVTLDDGRAVILALNGVVEPENAASNRIAAEYLQQLVVGKKVWVLIDEAQPVVRVGGVAGYIWRDHDGRWINRAMVRDGFAKAYDGGREFRYKNMLLDVEAISRRQACGLWNPNGVVYKAIRQQDW